MLVGQAGVLVDVFGQMYVDDSSGLTRDKVGPWSAQFRGFGDPFQVGCGWAIVPATRSWLHRVAVVILRKGGAFAIKAAGLASTIVFAKSAKGGAVGRGPTPKARKMIGDEGEAAIRQTQESRERARGGLVGVSATSCVTAPRGGRSRDVSNVFVAHGVWRGVVCSRELFGGCFQPGAH